jgi:hypothetical protein
MAPFAPLRARLSSAATLLILVAASAIAQDGPGGPRATSARPLPDQDAFIAEARKKLEPDESLQSGYVYVETRREVTFDGQGRPASESIKVFESYPGLPGEDGRWDRLIAEDGRPVPADQLARQDRERQKRVRDLTARQAREGRKAHARQVRAWEEYRRETGEMIDDVFRVFEVKMLGREPIEGHDTIAFSLVPRPGAEARTRAGKLMGHFTVKAWVSEADHQVVRVDAEAIDTVSIAWGLLVRIHEGARFSFERRKVNGDAWLPARSSYTVNARVGLVKMMRRGGSSEYSSYRRYTEDGVPAR